MPCNSKQGTGHVDPSNLSCTYSVQVATRFGKLGNLETLNVRNTPRITLPDKVVWLSFDSMLEGLVNSFVDIATKKLRESGPSVRLKTLAIGSVTFSDLHEESAVLSSPVRDTLQLRVYRVGYRMTFQGHKVAALDLIAKGAPNDAEGIVDNLGILKPYWLR